MLAEENKNAGTSALEGKEVLHGLTHLHLPPLCVAVSLDQKRRKK